MMQEHTSRVSDLLICHAVGPDAGPPIVLFHGVTRGWVDWTPIFSSVAARWQIWAPDARGHGGTGRAADKYKVVDYVDDAVGFLTTQLKEPALLWGHSLGAMVAAAVAAAAPDAVRGLFLEDPPYHTMGLRIRETPYHALFQGLQSAAQIGGTVDDVSRRIGEIVLPSADRQATVPLRDLRDRAAIRLLARYLQRLDPIVLTPLIEGIWLEGHDYPEIFGRIKCPVLMVQADPACGGAMSEDDAILAESLIPRCDRIRLKGIGHQAHWADPSRILALFHCFAESLR